MTLTYRNACTCERHVTDGVQQLEPRDRLHGVTHARTVMASTLVPVETLQCMRHRVDGVDDVRHEPLLREVTAAVATCELRRVSIKPSGDRAQLDFLV